MPTSPTVADDTWNSFTTTKQETCFVLSGTVRFFNFDSDSPSDQSGGPVKSGESIVFAAGETVSYRTGLDQNGSESTFERVQTSA